MKRVAFIFFIVALTAGLVSCLHRNRAVIVQDNNTMETTIAACTEIDCISSFDLKTACIQAREVIEAQSYDKKLLEKVFEKLVKIATHAPSHDNPEVIWNNFVQALINSAKVPRDEIVYLWNAYFSSRFVSLPDNGGMNEFCMELNTIKRKLAREYHLKKIGFKAADMNNPASLAKRAAEVFNCMRTACSLQY